MDGRMDGWMGGWVDGDGWMHGWTAVRTWHFMILSTHRGPRRAPPSLWPNCGVCPMPRSTPCRCASGRLACSSRLVCKVRTCRGPANLLTAQAGQPVSKGLARLTRHGIEGTLAALSLTPIHSLTHRLVRARQYASGDVAGFLRF